MRFLETIIDLLGFLLIKLKDAFLFLAGLAMDLLQRVYEKFLSLSVAEKVIFLNAVPAFFAVILPVARYTIFETWFYINNPLAVYMIGIVIIMFISLYFEGRVKFIVRLLLNGYYLFWVVYLPLAGELTKANPHEITAGYYINIAVPVLYLAASGFCYLSGE